MFRPNESFTEIVPRLEPLHENATPAELLILYFEPTQLHNKATHAVRVDKNAKEHLKLGFGIAKKWQERSESHLESDDALEDELQEIAADEYGKLAEEAQREVIKDWERYPPLAQEAVLGRAVLHEQLRLGLRRRLIHALAGAAVVGAIFVPVTVAGVDFIHEQQTTSTSTDEGLTPGQITAEILGASGTAIFGGLISFSTHGRRAGDRVARKKTRKKLGPPKYEEL